MKSSKRQSVAPAARGPGRPAFAENLEAAAAFEEVARGIGMDRAAGPLWIQLRNVLDTAITNGSLAENTRLPSEQVMSEIFQLSRPVIRAALNALTSEGKVVKQARRGMFVAPKPAEFDFMTSTLGVFDDLSAKGYKVTTRTHEFGLFAATSEEKRALALPEGFNVIRILRVYAADGRPLTQTRISLPAHRLPGFEKLSIEGRSIFGTIRANYGLTVARADRWLRAEVAEPEVCDRMEVPRGSALIRIESIAYDHDGNPLEFYDAYYNSGVAPIHVATEQHTRR